MGFWGFGVLGSFALFVIVAWIRFFLVMANPSVAFLRRMAWFDLSKVFRLTVIFLLLMIRRLDLVFFWVLFHFLRWNFLGRASFHL